MSKIKILLDDYIDHVMELCRQENIQCDEIAATEILMDLKINIDPEIRDQTGYTEKEIRDIIMRYPFSNFKINEFLVIDLADKEQIRVLPYFNIYNNLILQVSLF